MGRMGQQGVKERHKMGGWGVKTGKPGHFGAKTGHLWAENC